MRQLYLISMIVILFISSCTQNDLNDLTVTKTDKTNEPIEHELSVLQIVNDFAGFSFIESNDSIFKSLSDCSSLRSSSSSGGPYTVYGFTDRQLVKSYLIMYSKSAPKGLYTYVSYACKRYKYRCRFTIPKNTTVAYPTISVPNSTNINMGWRPDQEARGYTVEKGISGSDYEEYFFVTLADEIQYDSMGRAVPYTLMPSYNSENLIPNNFSFQYGWTLFNW